MNVYIVRDLGGSVLAVFSTNGRAEQYLTDLFGETADYYGYVMEPYVIDEEN